MSPVAKEGGAASATLTLENMGDVLTLREMSTASRLSTKTIREAIKRGELKAFIPGNRDPRKTGRGVGYRALKTDFQAWFFGANRGEA